VNFFVVLVVCYACMNIRSKVMKSTCIIFPVLFAVGVAGLSAALLASGLDMGSIFLVGVLQKVAGRAGTATGAGAGMACFFELYSDAELTGCRGVLAAGVAAPLVAWIVLGKTQFMHVQ
jgi:hypothetical protein